MKTISLARLATLCAVFLSVYTYGQAVTTYFSVGNGAWDDPSTWSTVSHSSSINTGTYPQGADDVYIRRHVVTSTVNTAAANVTLNGGYSSGTELRLSGAATMDIGCEVEIIGVASPQTVSLVLVDDSRLNVTGPVLLTDGNGAANASSSGSSSNRSASSGSSSSGSGSDSRFGSSDEDPANGILSLSVGGNAHATIGGLIFDVVDAGRAYVFVDDNSTLAIHGNTIRQTANNGVIYSNPAAAGTIEFGGGTNQNLPGTLTGTTDLVTYNDVVIDKNGGALFTDGSVNIYGTASFQQGVVYSDASNLITFKESASAIDASVDSHVSGPVAKEGNTAFSFPLGQNTEFRPLTISAPDNSTDAYIAEYFANTQTFGNNVDPAQLALVDCEYWDLQGSGTSSDVFVTLEWQTQICDPNHLLSDLCVAQWNGALWVDRGKGGTSGSITSGSITSPQKLTAIGPVILGFPSYSPGQMVQLSDNSIHWGTDDTRNSGGQTDFQPKQDQRIAVELSGTALYPNPATNEVSVRMLLAKDARITIDVLDLAGKKAMDTHLQSGFHGENTVQLDLSAISAGNYVVRTTANGKENFFRLELIR